MPHHPKNKNRMHHHPKNKNRMHHSKNKNRMHHSKNKNETHHSKNKNETHHSKNNKEQNRHKGQKGGVESMGATGMPARFYDANANSMNYGRNSGMGVSTAYGASDPLDAGVGNLAPFNVSNASAPLSMQQTGGYGTDVYDPQAVEINYNKLAGTSAGSMDQEQVGGKKKRRRRKMKGGETFTDSPVKGAVSGLQSSVDKMVNKFAELNNSMASFDTSLSSMLSGGAKRKPKRKCPKDAANKHKYGKRMKGMDGNMWVVVKGSTGSKRWSKVTSAKKKKPVKKMTKKKLVVLKKKRLGTKKKKPVKKTTKKKTTKKKTTKKKTTKKRVTKKGASKKKRR